MVCCEELLFCTQPSGLQQQAHFWTLVKIDFAIILQNSHRFYGTFIQLLSSALLRDGCRMSQPHTRCSANIPPRADHTFSLPQLTASQPDLKPNPAESVEWSPEAGVYRIHLYLGD